MKTVFITLLIFASLCLKAQDEANLPFKVGEKITYEAYYAFVTGANMTLEVKQQNISDIKYYHLVACGYTVGMIDKIYKIKEDYQSWINVNRKCLPLKSFEDVHEGSTYTRRMDYVFNNQTQSVFSVKKRNGKAPESKTVSVAKNCYDIVSAAYYLRTLDLSKLAPGQEIRIETFFDNEPWPLIVKYLKTSTVKVGKLGKISCYEFVPVVQVSDVFTSNDALHLWISADENKIPIRAQMDLAVGSCKVDIIKYENLNHPIKFVQ